MRLSSLSELNADDPSEPTEPPPSLPFLAQMDGPASLDIVQCEGEYGGNGLHTFHFVVVGPRSRFWLHLVNSSAIAFHHLALLCSMLPKETIEMVRFSVVTMLSFIFLPMIFGCLPSLTTLLIRHSTRSSPVADEAGILALARARSPRRRSVKDTPASREQSKGDAEGPSEDGHDSDEDESDSDDSWETADESEHGDQAQDDAEPSRSAASVQTLTAVTDVPAPRLEVVGLELALNWGDSIKLFIRAIEDLKKCGHPLLTVRHNMIGVNKGDVDQMKEHVVEGVSKVNVPLWIPTIDEGWRVKNDYWRLHPVPWDDLSGWGFYMQEW